MATHQDNRPLIGGPPPYICGYKARSLYPGKLNFIEKRAIPFLCVQATDFSRCVVDLSESLVMVYTLPLYSFVVNYVRHICATNPNPQKGAKHIAQLQNN